MKVEKSYFAIVTDLGTRKMLEAANEGKKVNITSFAVGDGGGKYYIPETGMDGLRNEVWRGMVNSCKYSEEADNVLIIESVIPSDVGGFTIREMGVFDEEGDMFAVCNTPDTQKVKVSDGVLHELHLSIEIVLSNTDSVELVIDKNVVTATKKDIERLEKEIRRLEKELESAEENQYVHPDTDGYKHIPAGGMDGQILINGGESGKAVWGNIDEITEEEILEWYEKVGGSTDIPGEDYITVAEIDAMYASNPDYGEGDVGLPDSEINEMYEEDPNYGEGDVGIPDSEIDGMYQYRK